MLASAGACRERASVAPTTSIATRCCCCAGLVLDRNSRLRPGGSGKTSHNELSEEAPAAEAPSTTALAPAPIMAADDARPRPEASSAKKVTWIVAGPPVVLNEADHMPYGRQRGQGRRSIFVGAVAVRSRRLLYRGVG